MKKLNPEFIAVLLKALRDEKLTNEDKALIRDAIKKSEEGTLTIEDYISFIKTLFSLTELFQKFNE